MCGKTLFTFGSILDHELFLRRVLARMQHRQLRLQPKKCEFFRRRLVGACSERARYSKAGAEGVGDSTLASFDGSHFHPCFYVMC